MMEMYLNAYLRESKVQGHSINSINARRKDLKLFFNWGNFQELEEIDRFKLMEFINYCQDKGLKSSTINTRVVIIKAFFKWLVDEEIISKNPVEKVKVPKREKTVIKTFDKNEVEEMINYYNGKDYVSVRNKTILTLLAETGIRVSELCGIKNDDVYDNMIRIKGKGNKQRFVPISDILHLQLFKYSVARDKNSKSSLTNYYFYSTWGKQMSYMIPRDIIRKVGKALDLDVKLITHGFRRFYAQSMLDNIDLYTLSRLLGHENIKTTEIYVRGTEDEKILQRGMNSPLSKGFP
ncbi:recombinase [Bacillus sp. AFS029533]|nr:recombinase [Bacillus sp. AFS029533]